MNQENLPRHIGIIMDGNGRWAKLRNLPRSAGHKIGAKVFRNIVTYCNQIGIQYLTVYAFSTENWKRPKEEVQALMQLFRDYLLETETYLEQKIQVRFIGDLSGLDEELQQLIAQCETSCQDFDGMHLNIALNYGGRDEIVHAMRRVVQDVQDGKLDPSSLDEQAISDRLYTYGQPDVDLIIRPSGEYRLSNFLIWQSAYAECVFMDQVLWPDFNEKQMDKALKEYARRNRRFGGV